MYEIEWTRRGHKMEWHNENTTKLLVATGVFIQRRVGKKRYTTSTACSATDRYWPTENASHIAVQVVNFHASGITNCINFPFRKSLFT